MIYASSMLFYKINKQELKEVLNKLKVSCSNNIDFSLRLFFFYISDSIQNFHVYKYVGSVTLSSKGLINKSQFKKIIFY